MVQHPRRPQRIQLPLYPLRGRPHLTGHRTQCPAQDSDALRERYAIRSQFREGAVANLKPAISGGNVVLSLEDSNIATALIMVNGAWELIAPQTIALPSPRTSGTDTLYLHWVLWRVTSDGHSTAAPRAWWTTA